jgi:inner membrane protease ATP23
MIEQMTKYFNSFLTTDEQSLHNQCMRWKSRLFTSSPAIIFMLSQLERVGCKLDDSHFHCSNCDLSRSGGFIPSHGILLCQNRLLSKQHLEDTLTHELVHAFDHCTTTVNWNDCRQLACSEIRAVSLSGECRFLREFKRGNFAIAKQHQVIYSNNIRRVLREELY